MGILFRRINGKGAAAAVIIGFVLAILIKIYVNYSAGVPSWLLPYQMQAIVIWVVCILVCTVVSLSTEKPSAEQVNDQLTINWKRINIFQELGDKWYKNVVLWWGIFVLIIIGIIIYFS